MKGWEWKTEFALFVKKGVEDNQHVLLKCSLYDDMWVELLRDISSF